MASLASDAGLASALPGSWGWAFGVLALAFAGLALLLFQVSKDFTRRNADILPEQMIVSRPGNPFRWNTASLTLVDYLRVLHEETWRVVDGNWAYIPPIMALKDELGLINMFILWLHETPNERESIRDLLEPRNMDGSLTGGASARDINEFATTFNEKFDIPEESITLEEYDRLNGYIMKGNIRGWEGNLPEFNDDDGEREAFFHKFDGVFKVINYLLAIGRLEELRGRRRWWNFW